MATGGLNDLESGGDETFDFLCVVCKGKNKNTEAEMFCFECHDYYCPSCVKCHDVIPALKIHQILDKSTAPLPAVPTEKCKEHKDKPVDMYCENHIVVGCSTCMLKKHSSCKNKHYIPDFITINTKALDSIQAEEILELESTFKSLLKSILKFQEAFIKEKEELKGKKDKVLKEIGTFREKINQLLDQFEKKIVQELEQKFKSLTELCDSNLHELQAATTQTKAAQEKMKSPSENMPQKFVSIKKAYQVVSSAKEKIKTSKSQVSSTEIDFLANQKLQTLFSEIHDLGCIRLREKLKITGSQEYTVTVKNDPNTYPVNKIGEQSTCYISSACALDDGTIILVDNFNSLLKRLASPSYIITDFCSVGLSPLQVCAISDTEVAVSCSCWNIQKIQFVNVGRPMKKTREIRTNLRCRALTYADERLFISDETSVYIFSLSGKELQQLYIDQSRQSVFSLGIQALAINNDMSRIFVAHSENGLIILDMNGQLVGQFNGDELGGAFGVCIDNNDNVLVCGSKSNVLQFSPDGKLIGEVLKSDRTCTAVCFNKNCSKLIVGCYIKDEIEVYDINAE